MSNETDNTRTVISLQNEYDIFISYRRDTSVYLANLIYERLYNKGYSVFLDTEEMGGGDFTVSINEVLQKCKEIILVLPPNGLNRCLNSQDILKSEIEYSLKHGKRIIPVLMPGFHYDEHLLLQLGEMFKLLPMMNSISIDENKLSRDLENLYRLLNSEPIRIPTLDRVVAQGTCGRGNDNVHWTLNNQGLLTINGNGTITYMPRFTDGSIHDFWNPVRVHVKSIWIRNDIIGIGDSCFMDFINLEKILIDAPLSEIPDHCFMNCHKLKEIHMRHSVIKIGQMAFYNCYNLESITLSGELEEIQSMAFQNCKNLKTIGRPDYYRSTITKIGHSAFLNCTNLSSVYLYFNPKGRIHGEAFANCTKLSEIHLPCGIPCFADDSFKNVKASVISGLDLSQANIIVTLISKIYLSRKGAFDTGGVLSW